jgi:signal transduction histidine kinase/DNA-binding response OmpR family regulator
MNFKNLKVGTQLKIGMGIIIFLVIILGITAYYQTKILHKQTETLYNHPLQVRRALGILNSDVLQMNRLAKDFIITENKEEIAAIVSKINIHKENAYKQLDILYEKYLGNKSDIDSVKIAFIALNSMREDNIRLLYDGNKAEVIKRMKFNGITNLQVEYLLSKIDVISNFAINKAATLYNNSLRVNNLINTQLFILTFSILLITVFIVFYLIKSINKPINELILASNAFKNGDYTVRSSYVSKNEFGNLSESYNALSETIEFDLKVNSKTNLIISEILKTDEPLKFSHLFLNLMLEHTHSQIGAIYLLDFDKKNFEYFDSIGLNDHIIKEFSAASPIGEFGKSLSSKKIEVISNFPDNTDFNFISVSGVIKPKQIINIPILSQNEVVAIISLASMSNYSKLSLRLINELYGIVNARIIGILAFRTITEFSKKLENQNTELESQKTELSSQANELTEQNSELEQQKKQLDDANKLKSNFLSNMSHELRTPLNSVIALSGVLNRKLSNQISEDEYSYLEVIERNGKHLLSLINDILDLSRIEAGKEELEISSFAIKDIVDELIAMIKPQAIQKMINLELDKNSDNPTLTSDFSKIKHILQNIIGNAVKFTENGGVNICITKDSDLINIKVSDTGIGISENQIHHIFDEFRQADGSTSRKYGGTGLGLAIAKKYVELLNGEIKVNSTPGKGSDFEVILPTKFESDDAIYSKFQPQKSEDEANEGFDDIINKYEKTILLVEDSEPAIIQLTDILSAEGYNIKVAHNGREALQLISEAIPDAMILDLMMPEVDGFEVIKKIRENIFTQKIPVIILTAKHISPSDHSYFKTNNIQQLIQKGDVNKAELLNAVAKMLNPIKKPKVENKPIPIPITGKASILIVEDNPDNLLTAKALLSDDFVLFEALDGFSGIEQALKHLPNLILMDIALPGMNGIDAFIQIRNNQLTKHIPVVVLTASAMKGEKEKIMSYGFDGYISKPIDNELFFNTIKSVLYGNQ